MKTKPDLSRYLRAVKRRLPLEKSYRARVLQELQSSIDARREAGQTDEEILQALGSPAQTAQELCEGLSEHILRKSPWRFAFLALAIVSALALAVDGLTQLFLHHVNQELNAVGVIGGADGPTAIFITSAQSSGVNPDLLLALFLLVLGVVGYVLLRRCKPKQ